jgi:hypothetical protein
MEQGDGSGCEGRALTVLRVVFRVLCLTTVSNSSLFLFQLFFIRYSGSGEQGARSMEHGVRRGTSGIRLNLPLSLSMPCHCCCYCYCYCRYPLFPCISTNIYIFQPFSFELFPLIFYLTTNLPVPATFPSLLTTA